MYTSGYLVIGTGEMAGRMVTQVHNQLTQAKAKKQVREDLPWTTCVRVIEVVTGAEVFNSEVNDLNDWRD